MRGRSWNECYGERLEKIPCVNFVILNVVRVTDIRMGLGSTRILKPKLIPRLKFLHIQSNIRFELHIVRVLIITIVTLVVAFIKSLIVAS